MNRFERVRKKKDGGGLLGSTALFVLVGGVLWWSLNRLPATDNAARAAALQQTVARAAVHCYALEGVYPDSLAHLKENYGLSWDESQFAVDYRCFAQNLMPDITVGLLEGGAENE